MQKDFNQWNNKKININEIEKRPFFHEREIWYCHLGINVGFEQDGSGDDFLRPVVIVRKFNNEIFWGIPLTNNQKKSKYYFPFSFQDNKVSTAILSQIRLIDARRLSHKIGIMQEKDFLKLIEKLKALLP